VAHTFFWPTEAVRLDFLLETRDVALHKSVAPEAADTVASSDSPKQVFSTKYTSGELGPSKISREYTMSLPVLPPSSA